MTTPDDRTPYTPGQPSPYVTGPNLDQYFPSDPSVELPPKKSRQPLILAAVVGLVVVIAAIVGITAAAQHGRPAASKQVGAATTPDPTPFVSDEPTASAEPIADVPAKLLSAGDVKLTVKITRQKCFGSAGCNVTYTIKAEYPPDLVGAGETYLVTYAVSGVEDGPAINTLTIMNGTQYEVDTDEQAETTKHVKSLKVKVSDVELQ